MRVCCCRSPVFSLAWAFHLLSQAHHSPAFPSWFLPCCYRFSLISLWFCRVFRSVISSLAFAIMLPLPSHFLFGFVMFRPPIFLLALPCCDHSPVFPFWFSACCHCFPLISSGFCRLPLISFLVLSYFRPAISFLVLPCCHHHPRTLKPCFCRDAAVFGSSVLSPPDTPSATPFSLSHPAFPSFVFAVLLPFCFVFAVLTVVT